MTVRKNPKNGLKWKKRLIIPVGTTSQFAEIPFFIWSVNIRHSVEESLCVEKFIFFKIRFNSYSDTKYLKKVSKYLLHFSDRDTRFRDLTKIAMSAL